MTRPNCALQWKSICSIGSAVLILLLLPGRSAGQAGIQVNDADNTGLPPNGFFVGSNFDTIQTNNGYIHIHLPLLDLKGRGPSLTVSFEYDSSSFYSTEVCDQNGYCHDTWHYASGGQPWGLSTPFSYSVQFQWIWKVICNSQTGIQVASSITLSDPSGGLHHFVPDPTLTCFSPIPNGILYADDGSGWMMHVDPNTGNPTYNGNYLDVVNEDGTEFKSTNTGIEMLTDSNGNQLTNNTQSGLMTDTLGRTMTLPVCNSQFTQCEIDYTDSSGQPQKVQYTQWRDSFSTNIACGPGNTCTQYYGLWNMPTQITLPNGLQYNFTYTTLSTGYSVLSSASLPTGGQVSWTYVYSSPFSDATQIVTKRTVTANGNSYVWNYAYGYGAVNTTTVTDPALNDTRYTCKDMASNDLNNSTYVCQTTKMEYFSGSTGSGTLLKTITNDYDTTHTVLPIRSTTTWAQTNQVSKVETDWDSWNAGLATVSWRNVINKREYAFGTGTPGSLTRTTSYNYLHLTNSLYLSANIANRPTSQILYEADGATMHARTLYGYDDPTRLTGTSGAVNHDYNNFSISNTTRGNATQVQRWRNTDQVLLTTNNYFDDLGNRTKMQDPASNYTYFDYTDSWYQSTCAPSSGTAQAFLTKITNAKSQITSAKYDSCSSLVGSTTDANVQTTAYAYDSMGRRTQTSLPDGGLVNITYGGTLPINNASTAKLTSSLNKITTAVLDDLGQVKQTQLNSDPSGKTCVDITHDGFGRVTTVTNPYRSSSCAGSSILTSYAYDPLGRGLTQVGQTDGSTITTSFADNCKTLTDEAGKLRKNCTDALGRVVQVFEPDNSNNLVYETDIQYDVADSPTSVQQKGNDPNFTHWRARTFGYNSLSQLTSSLNPEVAPTGGSPCPITYTYDNNGNLAAKVGPMPNQWTCATTVTTTYNYDQLNRLTGKTFTNGDPAIGYTYDQAGCLGQPACYNVGRRTGMTDAAGSEAWSYDKMGRTLADQRTTNNVNKTTIYSYNYDGSTATLTYPVSGRTITYTPNSAAQPISAVDTANNINYATMALYAPQAALSSLTNGNGAGILSTLYYNNRLQPCRIAVNATGTAPGSCSDGTNKGDVMDYTYDFHLGASDNGNVYKVSNNRTNASNRNINYAYDALNRISAAYTDGNLWGETYSIDPWGNLYGIGTYSGRPAGETLNQGVNVSNQLTNVCGGNCNDSAGNLLNDGANSYTYDAEGHTTTGAGVTYYYDGDGKRVRKSSGTLYWYGMDSDALDETDASGNLTNEYVFFGGKRIARRDSSSNVFYYFADHLGTSRAILQGGQTSPCYDQDFYPYGREVPHGSEVPAFVNTCPQNYKFTGKERDSESGLDNFGARYDSSQYGRFMTPDWSAKPMGVPYADFGDPQSLNLYAYVRNNPLSRVDRDGHYEENASGCGDNTKCQKRWEKAADKFAARREKNLRSKKADVRAAAAAYGARGEANGVHVGFDNLHGIYGSVDASGSQPGLPLVQVTLDFGRAGNSETITHEGTHVSDDMNFLDSGNIATGYNQALNPTVGQSEFNAFKAGAEITREHGFGPNDDQKIWDFLRHDPHYGPLLNVPVFDPNKFHAGPAMGGGLGDDQ